jgi:hypothetical protein
LVIFKTRHSAEAGFFVDRLLVVLLLVDKAPAYTLLIRVIDVKTTKAYGILF